MDNARNPWFFYVLLFFLAVIGIALFVKEQWLVSNIQEERDANYAFLGDEKARFAEERAKILFDRWVIQTGAMKTSFDTFIPSQAQTVKSTGIETLGQQVFPWAEQRLRAWWTLVYHAIVRASTAMLWWPLLIITAIPFLVDAFVVRAAKATSFGLTSPHFQGIAMRAIPIVVIVYFLLLFAPFVVHPALVPAGIFSVAGMVWVAISQFVKRG